MTSQEVPVYNFKAHQGSAWGVTLAFTDADDEPIPLTGATAKMQIRDKPGGTLYKELSSGSGITISGSAGTVALAMTSTEMSNLSFRYADYDLFVLTSGSVSNCQLRGSFELYPRVTVWDT